MNATGSELNESDNVLDIRCCIMRFSLCDVHHIRKNPACALRSNLVTASENLSVLFLTT